MSRKEYPNIPDEAFPFIYGSPEWNEASFDFHLELSLKQYELLKNCSNKVPDKDLLDTLYYLRQLPAIIEHIENNTKLSEEECSSLALFTCRLDTAKQFLYNYVLEAVNTSSDIDLKRLINAKNVTSTIFCPLGLPLPITEEDIRIGGVKNIAKTVRDIVYDWYGDDPPKDWLVTYSEISKRHNRSEDPPSDDDLKKYLKKTGLARIPDYKQD